MSSELIRSGEALVASGMCASMGFLAGMSADMTGLRTSASVHQIARLTHLMLQAIESPVAERTLVRSRDLALIHVQRRLRERPDCRIIRVESSCDGVRNGRR
jgi:hypothetical protein